MVNAAKEAASRAFNAAKEFLGIHSPSKKFQYIGENMASGMSLGFKDAMSDALIDMNSATRDLTNGINTDLNASYSSRSNLRNNSFVININIDNSGKDLTEEDAEKYVDLMFDRINNKLGMAV